MMNLEALKASFSSPATLHSNHHRKEKMAHAVANMSAVSAAAAPRFGAKTNQVSGARVSTFAQRTQARKVAAQMASRKVSAIVAESETVSSESSELYSEFKKLLVDYEFSFKVGDKISGKVFHCDAKGAWVDIGAKAAALCPASEASLADVKNVSRATRATGNTLHLRIYRVATKVDKIAPSAASRGSDVERWKKTNKTQTKK